jgi:hypothetical protein
MEVGSCSETVSVKLHGITFQKAVTTVRYLFCIQFCTIHTLFSLSGWSLPSHSRYASVPALVPLLLVDNEGWYPDHLWLHHCSDLCSKMTWLHHQIHQKTYLNLIQLGEGGGGRSCITKCKAFPITGLEGL